MFNLITGDLALRIAQVIDNTAYQVQGKLMLSVRSRSMPVNLPGLGFNRILDFKYGVRELSINWSLYV